MRNVIKEILYSSFLYIIHTLKILSYGSISGGVLYPAIIFWVNRKAFLISKFFFSFLILTYFFLNIIKNLVKKRTLSLSIVCLFIVSFLWQSYLTFQRNIFHWIDDYFSCTIMQIVSLIVYTLWLNTLHIALPNIGEQKKLTTCKALNRTCNNRVCDSYPFAYRGKIFSNLGNAYAKRFRTY